MTATAATWACGPTRSSSTFLNGLPNPVVRAAVRRRELVERERLPDALAQLVGDDVELREQAQPQDGIASRVVEAAVSFFPLLADGFEDGHGARC